MTSHFLFDIVATFVHEFFSAGLIELIKDTDLYDEGIKSVEIKFETDIIESPHDMPAACGLRGDKN